MEKITMNDIITFVMKAMDKSMKVRRYSKTWIRIYNNDDKVIFEFFAYSNDNKIEIETERGWYKTILFSDKDIARWNVLCEEVGEYESDESYSCFKNFFAEDDKNKITDINELNEDD